MELQQLERIEQHIHSLEEAYERERQQRDHLEKKYARLKRRFVRLERSHAKLLQDTHATAEDGPESSQPRSPEAADGVIDLTSPMARRVSSRRESPSFEQRLWSASPAPSTSSDRLTPPPRAPRRSLADEICSESPNSADDSTDGHELERPLRFARTDSMASATSTRSRRQLDFFLDRERSLRRPERVPTPVTEAPSFQPTPSYARPRPRRGLQSSPPERTNLSVAQYAPRGRVSDFELAPPPPPDSPPESPHRYSEVPSRTSSSSTVTASSTTPLASPINRHNDDEAASLALAQYLQEQENIAAYEEYETRLRLLQEEEERANQQQARAGSDMLLHQRDIDPDRMTYEELLQLGEEVGDVKKERWRQMAVQVLSSLPTHRWTGDNRADVSCIICQYEFVEGDMALTLPCAHVFHEGCVEGWVHENNSCPLCKQEIAAV